MDYKKAACIAIGGFICGLCILSGIKFPFFQPLFALVGSLLTVCLFYWT